MSDLNSEEGEDSGFVLHLTELRSRLIKCVLAIFLVVPFAVYFNDPIFAFVIAPVKPYLDKMGTSLVFTGMMDKFVVYLKVGVASSILMASPLWFYQLWKFIEPGLYPRERKLGVFFIAGAVLLFLLGISFAYYLVFPVTFEYLLNVGDAGIKPMLNISDYLSFVIFMGLGIGAVFELPIIFALLSLLGIVDSELLRKGRRYAIVIMSIVAAVITPSPDPISMFMVLVPLLVLYEISILLVRFIGQGGSVGTNLESDT